MQHKHAITTLNHLFFHHLDHYRLDRLLSFQNVSKPGKPGETMVWSTERFARSVFALRQFLLSSGLAAGDRVAFRGAGAICGCAWSDLLGLSAGAAGVHSGR